MLHFKVDLQQYFLQQDGLLVNPTLVSIRCIDKPTKFSFVCEVEEDYRNISRNILFEADNKYLLRTRLCNLFRVISENSNINELVLNGDVFHFPGTVIAEWLDCNKYVSTLVLTMTNDQSDFHLLCDAIRRNTTIKTIRSGFSILDELGLMLGTALRENKGIVNIEYLCNGPYSLKVLKYALGPASSIKGLTFVEMGRNDDGLNIHDAKQIEHILMRDTSLTSLNIIEGLDGNSTMIPILHGVVNSTITSFHFDVILCDTINYQNECMQMISKMNKLKYFCLHLRNFNELSGDIISLALRNMYSLNMLSIKCSHYFDSDMDKLKCIIQEMYTRKRQCELKLSGRCPRIGLIPLLKFVNLQSLICTSVDRYSFYEILDGIQNWKYIKELELHFSTNVPDDLQGLQIMFATAISKISSIENILLQFQGFNFFTNQVQNIIDQILTRNKRLTECKNNPDKVPITQWPELFAIADPIGLDFSYTCIRKIPDIFLSLLYNNDVQQQISISSSINNVKKSHIKREASHSSTKENTTAKRARQFPSAE